MKRGKKQEREAQEERQRILDEERKKKEDEKRQQEEELEKKRDEERKVKEAEQKKIQQSAAAKLLQSVQAEMMKTDVPKFPVREETPNDPTSEVGKLFKEADGDDVDESGNFKKHKPLTRLDTPTAAAAGPAPVAPAVETKLRDDQMRKLIQQVPTEKAKAFAFEIDWSAVHAHNIIEKKLRPWVKKKVTEYLGAEEQGMIEFIMRKVASATPPQTLLSELEGFLDEEAENFTVKMWRMLIFEVLRVTVKT